MADRSNLHPARFKLSPYPAARSGNSLAVRVCADTAHALVAGIASIIHAFDPQMILIGRELAQAGEALLAPVGAEVRRRVFPALRDNVCIEVATLADAPVIGAATLALRGFFHVLLGSTHAVLAQVKRGYIRAC